MPRDCFVWFPGERVDGPSRIPKQSNLRGNTMENSNSKPQDCYIRNIKVPESATPSNGSWLKRKDAKRADAFEGSPVPLSERVDRRR
jgi:hypothetical protein